MSTTTANILDSVFDAGASPVGDLVQAFDFAAIDMKSGGNPGHLQVKLAPAYGSKGPSVKALDDNTKIMVAGVVRALPQLDKSRRSYEKALWSLRDSPLLEADPASEFVRRSNTIVKDDTRTAMKVDWKLPDPAVLAKIQSWFVNFINDEDTVSSTQIAGAVLEHIVELTSKFVDKSESIVEEVASIIDTPIKKEKIEKKILDIAFLRFPDQEKAVFKLGNIRLHAWSQYEKLALIEKQTIGITCEYASREFKPRSTTLDSLKPETRARAIEQAEKLFD